MTQTPQHPVRQVALADYQPRHVAVDYDAIKALPTTIDVKPMGPALSPTGKIGSRPDAYVPYLVVMDTLNFQFWDLDANGQFQRYAHKGVVGALGMQQAFEEAWTHLSSSRLNFGASLMQGVVTPLRERIEREGVGFIFGDIPAAEQRREILLEVLDPVRLLTVSSYLEHRLVYDRELDAGDALMLAHRFPKAYGDSYLKKAQLTLMFLAAQRNATPDLEVEKRCVVKATACADYQLPKVLRSLGLLQYSSAVAAKVDNQEPLGRNSMDERAIRAATVLACDALVEHFGVDIAAVDFWLWANRNLSKDAKFHLTFTTDY